MKHTPSQNDVVNDYLENLDDSVAALFQSVRECILAAGPEFNESIKWKDCLVYGTTKNHIQTVVGKGKISLIFFHGVQITDPHGLLEGDGKKTRTMRIQSRDFNQDALSDYVQKTLQLS